MKLLLLVLVFLTASCSAKQFASFSDINKKKYQYNIDRLNSCNGNTEASRQECQEAARNLSLLSGILGHFDPVEGGGCLYLAEYWMKDKEVWFEWHIDGTDKEVAYSNKETQEMFDLCFGNKSRIRVQNLEDFTKAKD